MSAVFIAYEYTGPPLLTHEQMGCFEYQKVTGEDVPRCHYGTLVYQFTVDVFNGRDGHGEGLMADALEQFYNFGDKANNKVSSSDEIFHNVWLVSAGFACL